MPITFVGSETTGGNSGTSITLSKPSGTTTGDFALFIVAINNNNSTLSASGSNPVIAEAHQSPSGVMQCYIRYRWVTGSEPTAYGFTHSSSSAYGAHCLVYRGVDPTIPFDVSPSLSSTWDVNLNTSTISEFNNITTLTNNALAIAVGMSDLAAAAKTSDPTGYTLRANQTTSRQLTTYDKLYATAGATGAYQMTWNSADDAMGWHFALREEGAGTGGPSAVFSGLPLLGVG